MPHTPVRIGVTLVLVSGLASAAPPNEAQRVALAKKLEAAASARDQALNAYTAAVTESNAAALWDAVEAVDGLCDEYDALGRGTHATCAQRQPAAAKAREALHALNAEPRYAVECARQQGGLLKLRQQERARLKAAGAPIKDGDPASSERVCSRKPFAHQRIEFRDADHANRQEALQNLFLTAHPTRFLYLTRNVPTDQRTLRRGEAVLLLDYGTGDVPKIVTPDRIRIQVKADNLTLKPITGAPRFAVRADDLMVANDAGEIVGAPWDTEPFNGMPQRDAAFLKVLDPNSKDYAAFSKRADKFWACVDAAWNKLDPDGIARDYDVVSLQGNTKVENLHTRLEKQVCSRCKCAAFGKDRAKLARKVLQPLREAAFEQYAPIRERLEKL